jgi:outer membrane protein OmpA-like peptidoglycan-associated protein
LEELLAVMKKNKTLKIQVQGHICCLPGNVDGLDEETGTNNLSELRAKAVWEYLIKNGIEETRVSYIGFGHNQPIYPYPEKTELEKTLNRRVEIKILSK